MNKVEYLEALKKALKNTDKDIMEEIISDYEEHFQVGAENGKSEEQICEDLGSIDDLVAEIKEVYKTENKTENKAEKKEKKEEKTNSSTENEDNKSKFFGEWNFSFDNIHGESIGNVINNALNTAGEALSNLDVKEISKNVKKTVDEAANVLNKFADDYIKNQGNPFDFSKRHTEGYKENVNKSYDDRQENAEEEASSSNNVSFDTESSGKKEANEIVKEEASESTETMQEENTVHQTAEQPVPEEIKIHDEIRKEPEQPTAKAENVHDDTRKEAEQPTAQEEKVHGETRKEVEQPETNEMSEQEIKIEESEESKNTSQESKPTEKQLNLVMEGICADVIVKKSSNGKLNLNYENNGSDKQKQMYEFYSYKDGDTVFAGIRKVGKAVFFFNSIQNSMVIHVELPNYMGNVQIRTASGDIRINAVKADRIILDAASGDVKVGDIVTTDLKAKTSSGDVQLNDVNSKQLFAHTVSGDITGKHLEAPNMTIKTVSGDITTHNITSNIMEISSMSGDIGIHHLKSSESKIRTQSGDLSINDCTINYADITTISGDIMATSIIGDGVRLCSTSGDVTGNVNVKKCHASSKSGDVDITCNGDLTLESSSTSGNVNIHLRNYGNGYTIQTRTTSGGLYINYKDQHHRNLKSGTYTFGKESSELNVSSISGDIHVND